MGKAIKVDNISFSSTLDSINYTGLTGSKVFKITAQENLTLSFPNNLLYNDGATVYWKYYEANDEIELANGDSIVFKGSLVPTQEDGIGTFDISGNFEVSGNILELVSYEQMKPYQFKNLFKDCTTLTDASGLVMPDYTVQNCFEGMFYGCTSLTYSPKLIAETLTIDCYKDIFYGCTSLNHIVCYNVSDISEYVSSNWIYGVNSSGIFEINYDGEWNNTNKASHIPANWIINNEFNHNWENEYMQFHILTDGTILWKGTGSDETYSALTISYSKDNGSTWTNITATSEGAVINVVVGDIVLIKANNPRNSYDRENFCSFTDGTATFDVKGNIMSMIYGDNFRGQTKLTDEWALANLFNSSSNVISAEYLILPATIMTPNCYRAMFGTCLSLVKSPKILPGTRLAQMCYGYMFYQCALLETAPILPAERLVLECYVGMFQKCGSLTYIVCLAHYDIYRTYVENFYDAGKFACPKGIFVRYPNAIWPRATNVNAWAGVPSSWTFKNYEG